MSAKATKTRAKVRAVARAERFAVFGPPPLLDGEDAATYDELYGRVRAAVEPADFIDDMFVTDLVDIEWEILRLRRLKRSFVNATGHEALEEFLDETLDYELYRNRFAVMLAETLQEEGLAHDQAKTLARQCAANEPAAVAKVNSRNLNLNSILDSRKLDLDFILDRAKADRARELVEAYTRREPDALETVNDILKQNGKTLDDLVAGALTEALNSHADRLSIIERLDHLITIAETRRNVILREIERRRVLLDVAPRRKARHVEGEFEVIEKVPAKAERVA